MSKRNMRKSVSTSFQVYRHVNSSSSDTSTSSSTSENCDTPLKRFNRLLRSSVARNWAFFRKDGVTLRSRGRSVSDAGLCTIVDNGLDYLDIPVASPRRSLQVFTSASVGAILPTVSVTIQKPCAVAYSTLQQSRV